MGKPDQIDPWPCPSQGEIQVISENNVKIVWVIRMGKFIAFHNAGTATEKTLDPVSVLFSY